MSKYYTTNSLIESVRRRAMIPYSANTFKEDDFLAFANEELDIGVVPLVLSFHEDYLMYTDVIPLNSTKYRYEIPSRSMGNKIREVQFQDTNGSIFEMTRIMIEDLPYFQYQNAGVLRAFYIEGNEIVLMAANTSQLSIDGNLRVSYYMRCAELVSESRVAKVTAINRTTGVITLDSFPDNFIPQPLIDITSAKSPHNLITFDNQPIDYGNSTNPYITLSTVPEYLGIGDIVSNAEETIIPQVPSELHGLLSQRMACRCLEALGDTQGLQNALVKVAEMESKAGAILQNRVEGALLKIAPKNGFLRRKRLYWGR